MLQVLVSLVGFIKTSMSGTIDFAINVDGTTGQSLWLGTFTANKWAISFGGSTTFESGSYAGDVNTWVHMCYVYSSPSNIFTLYRNGISIGTYATTADLNAQTTNCYLGQFGTSSFYSKGSIDDFRIYKSVVLSASQVLELYTGRV